MPVASAIFYSMRLLFQRGQRQGLWQLFPWVLLVSASELALLGGLRLFLAWAQFPKLDQNALYYWAIGLLGIILLRTLAYMGRGRAFVKTEQKLQRIAFLWMRKLEQRSSTTISLSKEKDIQYHQWNEMERQAVGGWEAHVHKIQAIGQLLFFIPVLLWISWPLTLLLFGIALPVLGWLGKKFRSTGLHWDLRQRQFGEYESSFEYWRKLRQFWSESKSLLRDEWDLKLQELRLAQTGERLGRTKLKIAAWGDAWAAWIVVVVLFVCGILIQKGNMKGVDLLVYAAALLFSYKPVKEFLRVKPALRDAEAALMQIPEPQPKKRVFRNWKIQSGTRAICFQDVSFSYKTPQVESEKKVLDQKCFCLELQNAVWILGPNGCGKTTLLRLISGLEEPQEGSIIWRGFDHIPQIAFLSHVTVLPQHRTIDFSLLPECLRSALEIEKLPGVDGLSAGQKQRIGFAMVFLTTAEVVVLDEPFAFVHMQDREKILRAIIEAARLQRRVLIMTGHDRMDSNIDGLDWKKYDA